MNIYIDADGCPVVHITAGIAEKYGIPCTIVCDLAHIYKSDYCRIITVDIASNSADLILAGIIKNNDIVITQDYGLAAVCIAKGSRVINQNGLLFTDENIDSLLMSRHESAKARRAGSKTKGPKKRTRKQDNDFIQVLLGLIEADIIV